MSLKQVLTAFGAFLDGTRSREEVAAELYGGAEAFAPDAARLAVYGDNRQRALDRVLRSTFPRTRKIVRARFGKRYWARVVDRYFLRHPPRDYAYVRACEAFPAFVARTAMAEPARLPWLPDLADAELTLRQVALAPDEPRPFVAREYTYDVVALLEAGTTPAPVAKRTLAAFWRDGDLTARHAVVSETEMDALRASAQAAVAPPPTRAR